MVEVERVEVQLEVKADGASSSHFSLLSIFDTCSDCSGQERLYALTPSVDLCPVLSIISCSSLWCSFSCWLEQQSPAAQQPQKRSRESEAGTSQVLAGSTPCTFSAPSAASSQSRGKSKSD